MPLILDVILVVGLSAGFAGAVRLWRQSFLAGRREGLQALAARRGWSLTITDTRLGRGGSLRMGSRGGHVWTVEIRNDPAAGGMVTDYFADSPRWSEGLLIAMRGSTESAERAFGAELARSAKPLSPWPAPAGMVLLADADPRRRLILDDLARALSSWTAPGAPVLVLGPEGLRLRLRAGLDRADRMELFVDLAFDLSRVIGP